MGKQQFLFDLEEYSKEVVYQVRLIKTTDPKDQGIIYATFLHLDHCRVMAELELQDDEEWMIVEWDKKRGMTDVFDFGVLHR